MTVVNDSSLLAKGSEEAMANSLQELCYQQTDI